MVDFEAGGGEIKLNRVYEYTGTSLKYAGEYGRACFGGEEWCGSNEPNSELTDLEREHRRDVIEAKMAEIGRMVDDYERDGEFEMQLAVLKLMREACKGAVQYALEELLHAMKVWKDDPEKMQEVLEAFAKRGTKGRSSAPPDDEQNVSQT